MRKFILYAPAIVGGLGMIIGTTKDLDKGFAYWLGAGIGMAFVAAIPSVVIGTIHFLIVRNRTVSEKEMDTEYLDFEVIPEETISQKKKYSWYFLFCCYLLGFGALFFLMLITKND